MANENTRAIQLGQGFIRETLLRRQLQFNIEASFETEETKERLLYKLEEGKVFPSRDTEVKVLANLRAPDKLHDLRDELHSIKDRMDVFPDFDRARHPDTASRQKTTRTLGTYPDFPSIERTSLLGRYFFVSAVLALLDLSIQAVANGEIDRGFLKDLHPLVEDAKRFSKDVRVGPPNIGERTLAKSNMRQVQDSVGRWTVLLVRFAVEESSRSRYGERAKLVFRGLLRGIPWVGEGIDALIFGKA